MQRRLFASGAHVASQRLHRVAPRGLVIPQPVLEVYGKRF